MSKEERVWTSVRGEIHLRGFAGFLPSVWHDRDMFDRPEIGSREGVQDEVCYSTLIGTMRLSNAFSPPRHSMFAFAPKAFGVRVSLCASGQTRSGPGRQAAQTRFLTGFDRVWPGLPGFDRVSFISSECGCGSANLGMASNAELVNRVSCCHRILENSYFNRCP